MGARDMAHFALHLLRSIRRISGPDGQALRIRVGIHSGAVIAGVIGQKKFGYDIWGDSVNVASRMQSRGLADRIHVTEAVYQLLRTDFDFEPRGEIEIKGKGPMKTYFLTGTRSAFTPVTPDLEPALV
jgi:class 3 adenylate cyclase